MKKSFWQIYIPLFIVTIAIVSYLLFLSLKEAAVVKSGDAITIKSEYSKLNGEIDADTNEAYIDVLLGDDNLYTYATNEDIKKLFDEGTGVVYFGYPESNEARNVVTILDEMVKTTTLDKIYYYNIRAIRSNVTLNDNDEVVLVKGSEFYYYLLDKLNKYLDYYMITGDNDKLVNSGEKRLYPATVVFVKKGEIVGVQIGTEKIQTDSNSPLTIKQQEELKTIYKGYLDQLSEACDELC